MSHSSKQEARRQLMLTQPVGSVIFRMAIPTIVAFLIQSIYSLADTYFVSGLGVSATSAVSVNASLDQMIMMCGSLLAVGANSYIARLLGEGKDEKASRVLSVAFYIAFGIGLLMAVFGSIFLMPLVRLLGATPTNEVFAADYARYVLLAAPFMATSFVMNQCLRSEGSATLSMIGMGFGGVLNCILDPFFINGFAPLGLPAMGVTGASVATAISKVVSFGILLFPYLTGRSLLSLSPRHFRPSRDILGKIVSVGSSSMFRNLLAVVSAIFLNKLAGDIGDGVQAGIGVCTKVMMFPFSIILGFCTGFQPVAGFNWGAKRFDRVKESYRFSSWVSLIGGVIMAAILALGANWIIQVFNTPIDPAAFSPEELAKKLAEQQQMLEVGALAIRLQCLALPIHGWVAVVNMLCAGLGNAGGAVALSTSRQGSCFLPILYPMAWLWGTSGIAAVQAVADILSLALAIPIVLHMLKKINAAEAQQASGA